MKWALWVCFALVVSVPACASQPPSAAGTLAAPGAWKLSAVERGRLEQLAPDFLARADRARERGERAESPSAASDHAVTAALYLEAARVEAERIELSRRLVAEELRRDAVARQLAAQRYAALAQQNQAVIARAASDPASGIGPQSARTNPATAGELTRRARLALAAARVLGADAGSLADAERRVRQAGSRPDQARAALDLAERVLTEARK